MKSAVSLVAGIIAVLAFVFAGFVTSTDAQGALVYVFAVPICFGMLALGVFLSSPKSVCRKVHFGFGIFLILFLVAAFVPPFRFFPAKIVSGIAGTFEHFTGMTPFAWVRANGKEAKAIRASLGKVTDKIEASDFAAVLNWEEICILGPYSTEADAAELLGYTSATLANSQVSSSDSVSALIFLSNSGTLIVVDVPRNVIDFSPMSRRCVERSEFPIAVDRLSGRAVRRGEGIR
ncbi:MAG: hypothetical protein KF865_03110 [Bdellovibrionaceae bacterium]|nr:hypothetical protein [Pseudobdellovibrionaceae bacterium]